MAAALFSPDCQGTPEAPGPSSTTPTLYGCGKIRYRQIRKAAMPRYSRFTPADAPARRRAAPLPLAEALAGWLSSKGREPRHAHLDQLWKNWDMVMGPDLAPLAHPLGHRDGLLLVGGEDHFILQELTYAAPEILERVNAFMDEPFFHRVELHLLFGKTPLNLAEPTRVAPPPPAPRPPRLGGLSLDPSSPVGRCYEAYLRCFDARSDPGNDSRQN